MGAYAIQVGQGTRFDASARVSVLTLLPLFTSLHIARRTSKTQIAKAHGAYVVSTTSPASDALTSTLGADELIDYRAVDLPKELTKRFGAPETKFDLVFDTVGVKDVYNAAGSFLKSHGQYLDIGELPVRRLQLSETDSSPFCRTAGPHMDGSILSLLSAGLTLVARKFPWRIKYSFAFLEAEKRVRLLS